MSKPVVAVTIGRANYPRMFSDQAWESLAEFASVAHHDGDDPADKAALVRLLRGADACMTSWGVAPLDGDVLAVADRLGAMAHMGSSVKRFLSDGIWERGIRVTSAGVTLARDVAETTLGLMIVGRKRVWPLANHVRDGGWRDSPVWDRWDARELTRATVGIVGASNVGRHLISLLGAFECEILVTDPYLEPADAAELGVGVVELEELLGRSSVVSLHCPENERTRRLLDADRLALLEDGAVGIHPARGARRDEDALVAEVESGRLFAFLDVTDPEPPSPDSALRRLDNLVVTPHIAGCIENCHRMGELAVEELRRFFAGEPAVYEIRQDMLDRIA
ncbi:MAG: hydroxyacid dehydrogenase [Acidimicrobiales bacterium]